VLFSVELAGYAACREVSKQALRGQLDSRPDTSLSPFNFEKLNAVRLLQLHSYL
jgi:hypothetical protein